MLRTLQSWQKISRYHGNKPLHRSVVTVTGAPAVLSVTEPKCHRERQTGAYGLRMFCSRQPVHIQVPFCISPRVSPFLKFGSYASSLRTSANNATARHPCAHEATPSKIHADCFYVLRAIRKDKSYLTAADPHRHTTRFAGVPLLNNKYT